MGRLPPCIAAGRVALRRALVGLPDQSLVLVACSGGPDSLALACVAAFLAPRLGIRAGLVTVDHGLQPGSADRAKAVSDWATTVGLAPATVAPVSVAGRPGGPEAAARQARYHGLAAVAAHTGAAAVLLGHTLDDQAETVLLALARGAGPRGIAAMPASREIAGTTFLRPFLTLTRTQTTQICAAAGLTPWADPHNGDPAFTRSRLRAAMATLVETLGPDLVTNLARTAGLVATDLVALDRLADEATGRVTVGAGLLVAELAELDPAVRSRVLRGYALRLGTDGSALSYTHLAALDDLVSAWHGQGPAALPGGVHIGRVDGLLRPVEPAPRRRSAVV